MAFGSDMSNSPSRQDSHSVDVLSHTSGHHSEAPMLASDTPAHHSEKPTLASDVLSHSLSPTDPANPMNWPLHRKIYASAVAWAFAATVAFGITSYTAGLSGIIAEFDVTMTAAISGMSLYIFGIVFAPIVTPHIAERYGRSIFYLVSLPLCALFILGAGLSQSFASLAVCRFFAGLFGGPCLVLIEGTFADIWSTNYTNTYYACLGTSAYIGAALGPIVSNFVVNAKGWRWSSYLTLIIAFCVFLFGVGLPETYQREIPRRRAHREGKTIAQPPAQSGVTIAEMARITVVDPVRMLFTEPIVALSTLFLCFNFAVVFQWFITVPAVTGGVYGFTPQQQGLAFITAVVGAALAAATSILIEHITTSRLRKTTTSVIWSQIEYRLIPAMIGQFLITTPLFWIGWTASPKVHWAAPVVGTMVYVWGNVLIIISIIPYLFDAYLPAGTLSALTIAASGRLLFAGALPLCIVQMFAGLTGAWALSLFGFISVLLWPIPFALFRWGPKWRENSRYNRMMTTPPVSHPMAQVSQRDSAMSV